MAKTLVIFGATGQQGGSILNFVLNDPELSQQYTIRAITRDPSSSAAQNLQSKGVEVVRANLDEPSSLTAALHGAHTIFLVTNPAPGPNMKNVEMAQGKAVADATVAAGAHYLIFSTLPNVSKLSGGKYTKVISFDGKANVEEYIRTLPIKSAFFSPGSFMQNFQTLMIPRPTGDGDYVFARHVSPTSELPLIDTAGDTGKYVGAILAEPEKYQGKIFCAASGLYSLDEQAKIMSKVSGKRVTYHQIDEETFRQHLGPLADILIEMMSYQQEFGYYGPQTAELVEWAVKNARGKVKTFEEYLEKNPLPLQ